MGPRRHDHIHDHDHDHDHDHGPPLPPEENPLWLADNVTLVTVGIDIGSSGTQVVFSRLHLRRLAEDLSTRFVVVRREPLFRSDVEFTPFAADGTIDGPALGGIIDRAYAGAGTAPDDVDTGVVILTGEALRRTNARTIGQVLALRGGQFVTASAGHHLEATLAAYGSGAVHLAHELDTCLLNIDVGGGTTKFTVIDRGRIVSTAAVHVGGRLLTVVDGRLDRLEPAAVARARALGHDWRPGDPVTGAELDELAAAMADLVVTAATEPTAVTGATALTPPLVGTADVRAVILSGGVAEYVYGREDRDLGDLGRRLGGALRDRLEAPTSPWTLLPPGECIRATVVGAAEFSVQLSGNTTYLGAPDELLPCRDLPVARPAYPLDDTVDVAAVAGAIRRHLDAFGHDTDRAPALALTWSGPPSYPRLSAFATALVSGLDEWITAGMPLYLLLDRDVARTLGHLLHDELGVSVPLLVADGLDLWDFDYVDIGLPRQPAGTIPVTVKSLVFQERSPDPPVAPAAAEVSGLPAR